jgi:hypothetical protein
MQTTQQQQKAAAVLELLRKDGKINAGLVEGEVDWFFEYTTPLLPHSTPFQLGGSSLRRRLTRSCRR